MKATRTSRPAPKAPDPGPEKGSRSRVAPARPAAKAAQAPPVSTPAPAPVAKPRGKQPKAADPALKTPLQGPEKKPVAPKASRPAKVSPVAPPESASAPRPAPAKKPQPEAETARPAVPASAKKGAVEKKRVAPALPAEKPVPKAAPVKADTKKASAKKAVAVPVEVPPVPATPPKAMKARTAKTEDGPLPKEKAQPKGVREVVETPILKPKSRVAKKTAPRRKADTRITVYVARGGPARGEADYEQAFANRHQALAFLSNQHGLSVEEQRQLAKASRLKLNRRWHGSEACALREIALEPDQAAKVLRGEMASV